MSAREASGRKGKTERHQFKMAPIFQHCRIKQVAVDFTPLKNPHTSIAPTFVNNRLEMAPTFMLPAFPLTKEDEMWYSQLLHTRRIAESENSSMLIPRPKPDSICQICKQTYPDYISHIFDEKHKIALHASPFQKDIRKLVRRLRRERRERERNDANIKEEIERSDQMKRKIISKENIKD